MAYVKTDWENLPSTDTPITETALDNMENGIEYNDQRLNGTKPINNTIYADDVKCKNMFDPSSMIELNGQVRRYSDGAVVSVSGYYGIKVPVKPNTTYIISSNLTSRDKISNLCYFNGSTYLSGDAFGSGSLSFTTPNNCNYVTLAVSNEYTWLQIELGTIATTYTPYKAFATEYKWDIIQNQDVVFTNSTQFFSIQNINKYDRIRVAVNNSYNRTFYFYFEKNDLIGNSNLFQTLLSMPNGELASLALGRITLDVVNDAIGVVYDKSNATFPLTLKNIVGYYRGEQTSSSTSGTRMLSVENEDDGEDR